MSSLFSNDEKAAYQAIIRDVHDSFSRPITGYKPITISSFTENTSHNYLYADSDPNITVTTNTVSGVFDARVKYLDVNVLSAYLQNIILNDAGIKKGQAVVQFKLDKNDYTTWLKDAEYIKLDDVTLKKISERRNHGLFNPTFVSVLFGEVV